MSGQTDGDSLGAGGDKAFYAALVDDDAEELYENAPCAYLSTSPDGTIAKVNGTFLAWTGYERDELVGRRRYQDLLAPGDRIFHETHVAPLLRLQGHVREVAVEVVCRSGGRLPVIVNAVVKEEPAGTPRFIRTALFDATERRAYEAELLAARRRAEESEAHATALARTLQATFLPPAMLKVPGLDIGGAYRPAGDGSEVGGDFYDVFEVGPSPGTIAVVLGDVCGKGPSAAVLTALARYTVRAEAARTEQPSVVLGRLHEALVRQYPEQFCTALFVAVDQSKDEVQLTVASGGHHLPLKFRPGAQVEHIGEGGTLLGMLDAPTLTDTTTTLTAGDVVVLYTDGVNEARRGTEFFGDEGLVRSVVAAGDSNAQTVADAIVAAVLEFQSGRARDDIAVVVLRVPEDDGLPAGGSG